MNTANDLLADVPSEDRPKHIAIIMDGNGRWAQAQGMPRIEGHRRGVETVRMVSETCTALRIEAVTLYCLSSENWKRPQEELEFLMLLLTQYMIEERQTMVDNNIRLKIIGSRDRIPADVQKEMDKSLELTANNTGCCLCLAINYGGRAEIVDAVKQISAKVQSNEIDTEAIDEQMVSEHLYTAGMSDPDLLIRTAGEMRISNYLLWQISYSEMWITKKCWPEFGEADLLQAAKAF